MANKLVELERGDPAKFEKSLWHIVNSKRLRNEGMDQSLPKLACTIINQETAVEFTHRSGSRGLLNSVHQKWKLKQSPRAPRA